jgi:hypothetical protein
MRNYFEEQRVAFAKSVKVAVDTSLFVAGRRTDLRTAWTTWIFGRLCVTCHSINRLIVPMGGDSWTTIDHGSIANLSRNVIETSILVSYLTQDGVSDEEWSCRILAFHLHDCAARVRLFKGFGVKNEYKKNKEALEDLRKRMSENGHFQQLESGVQEKLLGGMLLYVDGLRAVARNAGWDVGHFDAVYTYLSAQSHSTPMSFYRMGEQGIDYATIAPDQFRIVGFALEHAYQSVDHATGRVRKLFPETETKD